MRASRVVFLVSVVLMVVGLPAAASAHDAATDHMLEDSVAPKTLKQERAMSDATRAANRPDAKAAAAAVTGNEGTVGSWTAPVDWPVVGIHVALLPNGKVLAYDSVGDHATESYPVHDHTRATVWDPATGTQTDVMVATGFNVFCSGLAHLPDGSVYLAGGNKDAQLNGINKTHIFNPQTNTWSLGPDMTYARWYPTVTGLKNGEMLITEGGPDIPEVRQTNGSLRTLSSASLNLPLYPWLNVAPDGRSFYSGPDQTMRKLDTSGTGSWTNYGQRDAVNRDYGGHAMYDIGKILVAGGGNSTKSADVIDINGATPTVTATDPMAFGRRQHNLTLLADGTALATGGNSSGAGLIDMNNGVYAAELWNPATGHWTTLASQQITRQYHSIGLLLPDGRVLSAGGGICGECDNVGYLAKNAEVFTPPYLYKKDGTGNLAARPTVTSAPSIVDWGTQMQIDTPDAANIRKVALVRLGAVTHSNDMDQRYIPLSYTAGSGTLTATAPANANVAPPGPYMLFVVDNAGVPSVAKMVSIPVTNSPPAVNLTQPSSGATYAAPANVDIAANASDTDGSISKVEFFNGATKIGEDSSAPYTTTWANVAQGSYSITARATDNAGKQTDSTAVNITVSGGGGPPPPPAFVQQTSAQQLSVSAASGLGAQPAANVQTGNRLVVQTEMWSSGGATAASVTDSAGNTYTKLLAYKAPDNTEMSIWTAPITTGGGTRPTVTVKPTGQTSMGISVLEYSGLSTAAGIGVVDKIASATGVTGASQTVASGPTSALANNNTLVLGLYSDSGFGVSVTKDATYTQRVNNTPSGISDLLVEDKLVNTGQTANATVTTGSNTHWLMATIALKPASADGPPPPPQVPGAPTGVSASAGNQSATVSWTAPSDGGSPITSYTVTPYIGATAQTAKTVSPPATTTTVTGLTNGTAYTFKVSATNTVGTGAQSTASNAVTPSAVIPPAFVQQASAQQLSVSAAAGLGVQPAANVQTGNRMIVQTEMWSSAGATAASVTDSAGNTYTKLLAYKAPDKTEMSIWTAPITAGGGTRPTVTVTPTGQTSMGISVLEYSGLSTAAGAGAVDKIASATGVTGAAQSVASGPTLAVANNNTLVLGLYSDSGFGVPVTKDATYTQRVNNTPSGISDLLVEDKLIDAGQTANATVTTGANTHWLMATIAFKPAGAAFSAKRASRSTR